MRMVWVFLIVLLVTNIFGAISIKSMIVLFPCLLVFLTDIKVKSMFKWAIIASSLGVFASALSCSHFRGQSILLTLKASTIFFTIYYYFVFKRIDLSIEKTEYVIRVLAVIFCFSYIVQYMVYPTVIFDGADMKDVSLDNLRIRLSGQGLASLGLFYALNKYLDGVKKAENLAIFFLCFSVIFLMGFRTMIASLMFFSMIMIISINGINRRMLISGVIVMLIFAGSLQIPLFAQIVESMMDRQENQVISNDEYIRVGQFLYYTQEHFYNKWEYFFGSGMPALGDSRSLYASEMEMLSDKGLNWVDWGLLSTSWMIGIPAVLAFIGYSLRAIFTKMPRQYRYLSIWFAYLLSISFTTAEFIRGNFVIQAIVLFMIEKIAVQSKDEMQGLVE